MTKIIAISDLHGYTRPLEETYKKYGDEYLYIIVGDIVDRGTDTKSLFNIIKKIPNKIIIRGNHEDMLMRALNLIGDEVERDYWAMNWLHNGGMTVLKSFFPFTSETKLEAMLMSSDYHKIIKEIGVENIGLLNDSKLYYKTDDILFVHAGVDPTKSLEEQSDEDLVWIRQEFLYHEGKYPYINEFIVHGHTPRKNEYSCDPYKFNLDGGYAYKGCNRVLIFDTEMCQNLPIKVDIYNNDITQSYKSMTYKEFYDIQIF